MYMCESSLKMECESGNCLNITGKNYTVVTEQNLSRIWLPAVLLPVGFCGIMTNGLVIAATVISKRRVTPYHAAVLSLTAGDFLHSAISPAAIAYTMWHQADIPNTLCTKWPETLRYFFKMHVFYMVALVAYGRYAVSRRIISRQALVLNWKVVVVTVISSLALNLALSIVRFVSNCHEYNAVVGSCLCVKVNTAVRIINSIAFFAPVSLSILWYGFMYLYLKRKRAAFRSSRTRHMEEVVSRTICVVLISFFIAFAVATITQGRLNLVRGVAFELLSILGPLTQILLAAVEPFFYGMKSHQVKSMMAKTSGVTPSSNHTNVSSVKKTEASRSVCNFTSATTNVNSADQRRRTEFLSVLSAPRQNRYDNRNH